MTQTEKITFGDIGISSDLVEALAAKKIINPTPIQEKCIPLGLNKQDIVGIAQTGTGKTFAFGLPAIEHIGESKKHKVLMVLPTRELAVQVHEALEEYCRAFKIRTALLIGGAPAHRQKQALKKNPRIIIATPGRLIDHMKQNYCNLEDVSFVVLDEADRMLDIGFMPQINEILKSVPRERQTMLFSATMSKDILGITQRYMKDPVKIEVAPAGTSSEHITQIAHVVSPKKKKELLENLLKPKTKGSTLIFTRTKIKAKKLSRHLRDLGHRAVEMHSDRTQSQRKKALQGFKTGRFNVLVATDVAARGLHVDHITLVVNHDLPDSLEDYVHRIGRTGRAGKKGTALTFVEPDEGYKLRQIEKIIDKKIELSEDSEEFKKDNLNKNKRRRGRSGNSGKRRNHSRNNQWKKNHKKDFSKSKKKSGPQRKKKVHF